MGREEDLEALDEEVNSLEVHIQEVEAGKRAIESLDAEAAEAAEAAQRVAERVSAEERKKAQLEQRGAGLSAASRDPVALKRTLVVLRKRNKALQHLHSTCSGSAVPLEPQARTHRQRLSKRAHSPAFTFARTQTLSPRSRRKRYSLASIRISPSS